MDVYRQEQIRNVIAATGEYDKTKFAENGLRNSVAGWQSSTLKATGRRVVDMTIHSTLPVRLWRKLSFSEGADHALCWRLNLCDVKLTLSLYPSKNSD